MTRSPLQPPPHDTRRHSHRTVSARSWLLGTILALAAPSLAAADTPTAPQPAPDRQILRVAGLQAPVDIALDRWGVAHVQAGSRHDAFYAQGFMAARDRLWQIDLWRKRGLGLLAKDLGPAYAEGDIMARAVLFRGDMAREWISYGQGAQAAAQAFVAGINAYVDLVERQPERMPEEFRLLGYRPARWQAEDIVRIRHHGLTLNVTGEIDRAVLYCKLGAEAARADWLRRALDPPVQPQLPEGLDPCEIPAEPLKRAYRLATEPARFSRAALGVAGTLTGSDAAFAATTTAATGEDIGNGFGSNNWVVGGALTATGRPILANDPHRAHGSPSLRYLIHLRAPDLDVIGAGEPFLPGVSIGHNGRIAFGLTRFYIDQEDLYVYETDPQHPDRYRYRGAWEAMTRLVEQVEVKGEAPRRAEILYTRHGPVLHVDAAAGRAWALRAAWLEPGMAPYFGSVGYMGATDWNQFRTAMRNWGAPAENQVYADSDGNIGWVPGGRMPIRQGWDGLFPVPGDGRYEWTGFRDGSVLPQRFNPDTPILVTANENTIPADHPAALLGLGFEWSDPARAQRLHELAGAQVADAALGRRHDVERSAAWQNDTVSMPARRLVPLLASLKSDDARLTLGLDLLRSWNGDLRPDSAAAALFEVWFQRHVRPAIVTAVLSAQAARQVPIGDVERTLLVLEGKQPWLDAAARDRLLMETLRAAMDDAEERMGSDMTAWRWGGLHPARFRHPLDPVFDEAGRARLNVGHWPIGGSASTLAAATYTDDFNLVAGASFRMIVDVGNWDASLAINTPGQSGDPRDAHYRDLAPLWARGRYFPLLYSASAIERDTVKLIRLEQEDQQ